MVRFCKKTSIKPSTARGLASTRRSANSGNKKNQALTRCNKKNQALTRCNKKNQSTASTLYFAIRRACCKQDDVDALRTLLPTKQRDDGQKGALHAEILHGLVKEGCVECVRYLLCELKFDVNLVRHKNGCTPLHTCFYNLQGAKLDRMADLLVQLGADQKAKNKWGEFPCMFEFKEASVPIVGGFPHQQAIRTASSSKLRVAAAEFPPPCCK